MRLSADAEFDDCVTQRVMVRIYSSFLYSMFTTVNVPKDESVTQLFKGSGVKWR